MYALAWIMDQVIYGKICWLVLYIVDSYFMKIRSFYGLVFVKHVTRIQVLRALSP